MKFFKTFFKKNFNQKLVWTIVIFTVIISLIGTKYELAGYELRDHPFLGFLLSPFDQIRYGHYMAKKFFLVIIAFLVFVFWLKGQKNLLSQIKPHLKYIALIGIVLVLARILTFGFWFYNDDTRFFNYQLIAPTLPNYNLQGGWGPYATYPIAIFLLVIGWFGTNYTLYNSLGLLMYFLAGIAIYALSNKIQNSKFVSLVAALFLLTTPTNFQGRLLIGEIMNSPFAILLIVLSVYLLLQKFIPGALIFAAAALEYGVARTYIAAVPLILSAIFFNNFKLSIRDIISQKKSLIFLIIAALLISLVYLSTFYTTPTSRSMNESSVLNKLIVLGDVLLAVSVPHALSHPVVKLLDSILHRWIYTTASLGFLAIFSFAFIGLISLLKGKMLSAKLVLIGLLILVPSAAAGSVMGVRVDRYVPKLTEYVINSPIPIAATGYGILPALGLTFILIGIGCLLSRKVFYIFALFLISVNIISSYAYDYHWLESPYAYPQRRYNEQLQKIIPRDNIAKYIYVPSKERPFYQGVITFTDIFQGDQNNNPYMEPEEFVSALKKNHTQPDHIYFLITSGKPDYQIYDYSDKVRNISYDKLEASLRLLTVELTPSHLEF